MYQLQQELKDGTLDMPFSSYASKKTAFRIARAVAKSSNGSHDIARIIVSKNDSTVAIFELGTGKLRAAWFDPK